MDIVTLFALLAAWGTILMLIISLINFFEDLEPRLNTEIANMLRTFPNLPISDTIKKSNQIFLQLFDRLYATNSEKNFYLWFWIFFSTIFTIIFGLNFQLEHKVVPPLEKLLLLSLILPTLVILYMRIFKFREKMFKKLDYFVLIGIFQGISQVLLNFVIIISEYEETYFNLDKIFSVQITSNQISLIVGIFLLGSLLLILFIYFSFEKFRFLTKISPTRAMLSSLLAILIVALLSTLFNEKIFQCFISDFNKIGITMIAYIFLNVFADSISLWETNIILRSETKGSILKLFSLLILDIILSALIFLAIPWSTGNLHIFFDAIKFQGDIPWLGILFWSTFFTSIMFYVFVLSTCMLIALQRISHYYIGLDGVIPIMDKPLKSLGVVVMFLITIVFIIIAIIE